jgi:hypothetical protein
MIDMQTIMLAADNYFAEGQRAWAMEVRKLDNRMAKLDAVLIFLKNFRLTNRKIFWMQLCLSLKGIKPPVRPSGCKILRMMFTLLLMTS